MSPPKSSSRRFTKRMVIANTALAWAAVFLSILYAQAAYVAATAIGLILAISGAYMGIGHMDLRQMLKAMLPGTASTFISDVPADPAQGDDVQ
ncbi:hypothetical protein NKJ28_00430 [Mesorhizobium sp. M0145]|uniref:hypothetical protein n=1 Tax=unclassified Mesorhizobium TaxID=325217 RepID=UPI00333D9270